MKGYNRCMALKIPVTVTLSARSGLCFAAPVHVYVRAGLSFNHRREGSASSFEHRSPCHAAIVSVKEPR
jgi:hypothetical protein